MKKITSLILAAAAMVFAVACNKELPEGAPEAAGETVVFTASMDGADSKAVLNETTKFSEWEAGDKVTIHNGTTGFEFTAAGAGASTELSYTGTGFSGSKFMAAYPSCASADIETKTVKAYIPTWQQAQVGTYHHDAALAVAYTENDVLAFKNATALLKFTVGTDNVTHVVFHGNLGEGITGNVNVKLTDAGTQVEVLPTEIIKDGNKIADLGSWVEMYAYHDEDNRYFEKGETYYIAVAPQTFAEGVTVKIRINEGEELLVKTTTKAATFNANTVYNLGEFVYEASAVTPTVSKVYLRPGVWSADGAWFSAHLWGAENQDITLTEEENGLYSVSVSEGQTGMKFCRMNPAYDAFSWNTETEADHVWTETGDLSIPAAGDNKVCYVVTGWDSAEWMTVEEALAYQETETPDPSAPRVATVYLRPGVWSADGAWFSAHLWGAENQDITLTEEENGLYSVSVSEGQTGMKFCRMNPAYDVFSWNTETETDHIWTETGDLEIPEAGSDKVCYVVTGWDSAEWMTVEEALAYQETETPDPSAPRVATVYLRPGVWDAADAWFSAHFWGSQEEDITLTHEDNGLYSVSVKEGQTGVIFCRMNPTFTEFEWDQDENAEVKHVWNKTSDLVIPAADDDKVCYVVTDWNTGEWKTVEDALAYVEEETPSTPDVPLPSGQCEWGLIGQHQGWSWENLTPMTLVQDNIYAAKDVQLVASGFKFAKFGGSWDNGATYFGAYQNTEGKEYFDWQTQGMTGWYEVWDDNLGGQSSNIGVNDFTQKYDIYLKLEPINATVTKCSYQIFLAGTVVEF